MTFCGVLLYKRLFLRSAWPLTYLYVFVRACVSRPFSKAWTACSNNESTLIRTIFSIAKHRWTTLLTAFFSGLQLLLIFQINVRFGISNFVFALGDEALASFVVGIQFLPLCVAYLKYAQTISARVCACM